MTCLDNIFYHAIVFCTEEGLWKSACSYCGLTKSKCDDKDCHLDKGWIYNECIERAPIVQHVPVQPHGKSVFVMIAGLLEFNTQRH